MTVGVNETFAASIGGDASVTWQWTASGPGNATITPPNFATTQISVDTAGDYVFTAEASSTDANLTGANPQSVETGSITATDPTPAGVTLNLTGAAVGNSAYGGGYNSQSAGGSPLYWGQGNALSQGGSLYIQMFYRKAGTQ